MAEQNHEMGRFILISGGARSGKSRHAQALAEAQGAKRLFVATAQAWDTEMQERISIHQRDRGQGFQTLEAPMKLAEALHPLPEFDVILIDCLTLWISNHLLLDSSEAHIREDLSSSISIARQKAKLVILVSNEVGLSIVPENPLARRFRDLSGIFQQELAAYADEVYFALLGQLLPLHQLGFRPSPGPGGSAY